MKSICITLFAEWFFKKKYKNFLKNISLENKIIKKLFNYNYVHSTNYNIYIRKL